MYLSYKALTRRKIAFVKRGLLILSRMDDARASRLIIDLLQYKRNITKLTGLSCGGLFYVLFFLTSVVPSTTFSHSFSTNIFFSAKLKPLERSSIQKNRYTNITPQLFTFFIDPKALKRENFLV